MKKIIVIGSPGSGKSTFSRKLRDKTGLPLFYLDMLWHKPDKTNISTEEFDHRLGKIMQQNEWIIDGNYLRTLEMRLQACDTVFFLDYPLEVCLEGARMRIGREREDMPWKETEFDEEFHQYIADFPKNQLPQMYEILEQYKEAKNIITFHSREESEQYLQKMFMENYQEVNAKVVDAWCKDGWIWGKPVTHEIYAEALNGKWDVCLTPTRMVPHEWFGNLHGKKVLGLASGGGQQIPVFAALGAECTVLDYSTKQCESERMVAKREGYAVTVIQGDMTKQLPFENETFDLIFHPVSNCYVENVEPIFKECYRVLKKGGIFLGGYDIGINYIFDDSEKEVIYSLPFNPLKDEKIYEDSLKNDWGIQFSHTLEEQIGGQLRAGFRLTDLYEDTNGEGNLHDHHVPSFVATRCVKEK